MTILADFTIILTLLYGMTIVAFLFGMKTRRFGRHAQAEKATVIIAARNEEKNIAAILQDLARQTYPAALYEVIVANDHSTDATTDIVRGFCKEHGNFKLLEMGDIPDGFSPKKYAIQSAVQQAQGDIILATDADCRVGPHWLKTMVSYFEPEIGFVIGFSQFGAKGQAQNLIERFQAFDFVTIMGAAVGSAQLGTPFAATGQNLAYRKSAFAAVGGYSKVSHRVSGDDVLLLQLVRKYTPYKTVFAGDSRSYALSEAQPTLKAFINQRKRWASNGGFQIRLNIIFFLYLLLVLLFNASLFIGIPAALVTGRYLSTMIICLGLRVLLEFAIALRSAFYFERTDLLKYFPLWFIAQIPYIVGIGLAGTFGKFQWKGRKHSARVNP